MEHDKNDWDIAITKIINAISDLKMANTREEMIKISIQYMILKTAETEEIFNDNMLILDRYAENGSIKKKILI